VAISKRLRFEILRRDNHTCRYCGASAPDVKLVIDHVIPDVLGGKTEPANLVAACEPCNSGKTSVAPGAPLVDDVAQDAFRWGRAMELAASLDYRSREMRDGCREDFLAAWNNWVFGFKNERWELPVDWPTTIDRLYEAGLNTDDIEDAVDVSMRAFNVRDRWRYFCGVAWKAVARRHELAATIAASLDETA